MRPTETLSSASSCRRLLKRTLFPMSPPRSGLRVQRSVRRSLRAARSLWFSRPGSMLLSFVYCIESAYFLADRCTKEQILITFQFSLLCPIDGFWRRRHVKQRKPKPRQKKPRELLRRWMPQREQDILFSFENFDLKLEYQRQAQAYRHRTIAYDIQQQQQQQILLTPLPSTKIKILSTSLVPSASVA